MNFKHYAPLYPSISDRIKDVKMKLRMYKYDANFLQKMNLIYRILIPELYYWEKERLLQKWESKCKKLGKSN